MRLLLIGCCRTSFCRFIIMIQNLLQRKCGLPMSLLLWKVVCTSCLSGAPARFGKSVYIGHALLMHELFNFIVPSSSSCNLTFSAPPFIRLRLSLTLSVTLNHLLPLSRPVLLPFFKASAPVSQIHLCMNFNDLGRMSVFG